MAVVIETTDRVRAKRALEASEAQFRTLASAMPNQVWSATPGGDVDWISTQTAEYVGVRRGSPHWSAVVHPDDRAAFSPPGEPRSLPVRYQSEFRMRRHDGVYRWHLTRATPVHDRDGSILRWVGSNTDIHEQDRGERGLGATGRRLCTRAADRPGWGR